MHAVFLVRADGFADETGLPSFVSIWQGAVPRILGAQFLGFLYYSR